MGAFWDGWNRQGQINQQQALSGLQQVRGLAGLMQEARAMQDQAAVRGLMADPTIPMEQKRTALLGMVRDPVQANTIMHQMSTEKATEDLRAAQMETQRRLREVAEGRAAEDARIRGLSQQLGGLLSPDVSTQGEERTPFVGSEAELVKHMQTNPGVYRLVNPAQVRSLQAQIDPERALTGLLAQPKPAGRGGLINVAPGGVLLDPETRQPVFTAPFAPRNEPKTTPYSDLGRIRADVASGILSPSEGDAAVKALQAKKDIVIDRGTVANAFKFRQEYTSNPEVKRANMLESSITPIAQYIANVPKTGMNPTADLALVKAFLSITHPKGDQISNLDRKELGQLGTLAGRFGNSIESFIAGKNLPDNVRMDMWNEVSSRYKGLRDQRDRVKAGIIKRAEQARVPADLIFEE